MSFTIGEMDVSQQEQFAGILLESFPPAERDGPEEVLASIAQQVRRCYLALEDETLVGFAVILPLNGVEIALLEYLAVRRDRRNAGIGGRLFDSVIGGAAVEGRSFHGVVLEAESPEVAEDPELARRRIGFYIRHGATVVDGAPAYRVPSTVGPELLHFKLMWTPRVTGEPLTGELLRSCVHAILTQDYLLAEDDGLLAENLASLVV